MKRLSLIAVAATLLATPALADTILKGWIISGSPASIRDCHRQGGTVVNSHQIHCYIYKH